LRVEKDMSSSDEMLGDIIAPMRTAVSALPVESHHLPREDLIDFKDIAPLSLNEEKRSQNTKPSTEDPNGKTSTWPWLVKNSETEKEELPDWSWLINKFGKSEPDNPTTRNPAHVAKILESTEAEAEDTEDESTTPALFPDWFLNAFGSNGTSNDSESETTLMPITQEKLTLMVSEKIIYCKKYIFE